jgi:hypothetical protein
MIVAVQVFETRQKITTNPTRFPKFRKRERHVTLHVTFGWVSSFNLLYLYTPRCIITFLICRVPIYISDVMCTLIIVMSCPEVPQKRNRQSKRHRASPGIAVRRSYE